MHSICLANFENVSCLKLEARRKREMNKRLREEKAEQARKKMKTISNNNTADDETADVAGGGNPVKAVGDTQEI